MIYYIAPVASGPTTQTAVDLYFDTLPHPSRFAQRVAMVKNTASVNEELDPTAVISRLKVENRDLKEEIKVLKGGDEERGPLTSDELQRLKAQVEDYCSDSSPDATLNLNGSMMLIRAAWGIFKKLVTSGGGGGFGGGKGGGGGAGESGATRRLWLKP